jgi:phospholipid/cholesterol/gamma-HCH transport system substrate-binding protein
VTGMRSALVRIVAFVVVSAACAALVIVAYGSVRFAESTSYAALFSDASGLQEQDDVRVAGITVGQVEAVSVGPDNLARVEFTVDSRIPLTAGAEGFVRYKNLLGQRYLEIREGSGPPERLAAGGVIPAAQTHPALDLDELYNGFSPLFEGLQPAQVNELSGSLISVFQGQGGSIESLLAQVGTLTSTLADRDRVIGQVVTNLDGVLAVAEERSGKVSDLVVQLQQLVSGLAEDRETLGRSLAKADELAGTVEDLLDDARPDLRGNVHEIERLARVFNEDAERVDLLLQNLPGFLQSLGRAGIYQQGFQFYLCGVQVRVAVPNAPPVMTDTIASQEPRCQF